MIHSQYHVISIRLQNGQKNRPALTDELFNAVRGMTNRQAYRRIRNILHNLGYSKTRIKRLLSKGDNIDTKYPD